MSIKSNTIHPGDRISMRHRGKIYTRTVLRVGEGYVTVILGAECKIMEHNITSVVRG